jgi:glutamate transport system permease protein
MSYESQLFDAQGPKGRRRMRIASVIAGAVLLLMLWAAFHRLASKGQFDHDRWALFSDPGTMKFLLGGLMATLKATAISAVLSGLLALPLALARLSGRRVFRWASRVFIEVFRAVPVLLLILFLAIGLPQLGIQVSALTVLVVGLTLYNSAVIAEIVRAGILSLDRGQREAALALGQSPGQAMRLVVLPQALRRMIPALLSQLLAILQDTSLGYVIPYDELLRRGQVIASYSPRSLLPSFMVVATVYGITSLALLWLTRWVEHRQQRSPAMSRAGRHTPKPDAPFASEPVLTSEAK